MENVHLKKRQGFTLIEILVVISIIGTIAVLGLGSYLASLRNGRDARRRGDLKAVQNAFEQYYGDNGKYPNWLGATDTDCSAKVTATYMPAGIPADPTDTGEYIYNFKTGNTYCALTSYCLCAKLESATGNALALPAGSTCTFSSSGVLQYYCVGSLQ